MRMYVRGTVSIKETLEFGNSLLNIGYCLCLYMNFTVSHVTCSLPSGPRGWIPRVYPPVPDVMQILSVRSPHFLISCAVRMTPA